MRHLRNRRVFDVDAEPSHEATFELLLDSHILSVL